MQCLHSNEVISKLPIYGEGSLCQITLRQKKAKNTSSKLKFKLPMADPFVKKYSLKPN
jgi:hypothetical protein